MAGMHGKAHFQVRGKLAHPFVKIIELVQYTLLMGPVAHDDTGLCRLIPVPYCIVC